MAGKVDPEVVNQAIQNAGGRKPGVLESVAGTVLSAPFVVPYYASGGRIGAVRGEGEGLDNYTTRLAQSTPAARVGQAIMNDVAPGTGDAPTPAPEQPTDPNAVPTSAGGGESTALSDEEATGALLRQEARDRILDLSNGPTQKAYIRPEGRNYLTTDENGKQVYKSTFKDRPQMLEEALRSGAQAEQDKNEELSKFYGEERGRQMEAFSAYQARRQQDQDEIAKRQQELDQAVKYHTQDLADQGKFWRNPGNIIAAISYSLMPILSNDPTIGAKLVNQAVEQDFAQRQAAANARLGALQSNLHGYQRMAGDRQAGDLLALSEAHRMAALEVQRIASKFEGPIAKARSEAIIQDQMMKSQVLGAEFYNKYHYTPPQKMDPALAKGYATGIEGAWEKYGADASKLGGGNVSGEVNGTPSVIGPGGTSIPSGVANNPIFNDPKKTLDAALNNRVPGGLGLINAFKISVARQAAAVSGYPANGNLQAYNKAKVEILNKAEEDIKGFAAQMAPLAQRRVGISNLQRDMDIIERSEKNPDEWMGRVYSSAPAFMSWYNNVKRVWLSDRSNKAAEMEYQKAEAAMRFRSAMADQMVEYYHGLAGANQSPTELANLGQVLNSRSSWTQTKAWVHQQSMKLAGQEKLVLAGASNPLAAMLYITQTGIGTHPMATKGVPAPKTGMDAVPAFGVTDAIGVMRRTSGK